MKPKDVVFTALFGEYETLNELTNTQLATTRYICFTDNINLKSKTWEVWAVNPAVPNNPARSSRAVKMLGHRFFETGTRLLYVDNTVRLKVDGAVILDAWLNNSEIAFMHHTLRKRVRGEFFACSAYGLDTQAKIKEQFLHYKENFPWVLEERPLWGGMIAMINTPQTEKFMATWDGQFKQFSKRDQLSINVSAIMSKVQITSIDESNSHSQWHEWPIISNRNTKFRDTTSGLHFRKLRIIRNAILYGMKYLPPFG